MSAPSASFPTFPKKNKFTRWLILLGGLLVLVTAGGVGLGLVDPTYWKIMRYQKPTEQTFCIFPQRVSQPSTKPFHFARAKRMRTDLDTLGVYAEGKKKVLFKEYLQRGQVNAFLVIRQDTVIYEYYSPTYSEKSLTSGFSMAKSLLSALVGVALQEGYIQSLDQSVGKMIPELESIPHFQKITLRHLLQMQSGLAYQAKGKGWLQGLFSDEAHFFYTDDLKRDLIKVKADTLPGTRWKYSNIDPLLLGWALEEATGQKIASYFEQKIWQPIGAHYLASWSLDQEGGLENTASSFQATALDFAKIGRLYLHGGKWNGKQVIPSPWVAHSTRLDLSLPPLPSKGWQRSTHQFYWWIPQFPPVGDFAAEGLRGQRIYVHPASQTIIVQLASGGAGDYPYRKIACFLSGMFFEYP